jgi:hypothetical protein
MSMRSFDLEWTNTRQLYRSICATNDRYGLCLEYVETIACDEGPEERCHPALGRQEVANKPFDAETDHRMVILTHRGGLPKVRNLRQT